MGNKNSRLKKYDIPFILNHIYKDATIYLERKYKQFDALFGDKKDKEFGELLGTPKEDNQQPNSENDIKVSEKVQRLDVEESTNNTSTSAEQPNKTAKDYYFEHLASDNITTIVTSPRSNIDWVYIQ